MNVQKLPKVSVCVSTYNQENYIGECLQSIIDQQTDFEFEILVGEDCSLDGTRAVIMEYADRYPGIVKPLFREKNVGATLNYFMTHNLAKGDYIAHFDGDDRMLPGKLQKEADFLDQHLDCAIVTHDVRIFEGHSGQIISNSFKNHKIPEKTDINYLILNGCFFAHGSKMYRRSAMVSQYRGKLDVDFYVHVEQASMGKIGYIDEVLFEYRKVPGTCSDRASRFYSEIVRSNLDAFERALELGVDPVVVARGRLLYHYSQAYSALLVNDVEHFKKTIFLDKASLQYASAKHRLFNSLSFAPRLVVMAIKLKEFIYRVNDGVHLLVRPS